VIFPESGALFFDVSDPALPKFLSWYRGAACEVAYTDVNCGAFVDLSDDGKIAFLSVQSINAVPGVRVPDVGVRPVQQPGVEVLDLRDPTHPRVTQMNPVFNQSGVHTARSHIIPEGPPGAGRVPGEYLFSIVNWVGVQISRVSRVAGVPLITPARMIKMPEVHDTFIQNDAITGRTYLYVAAGLESGFYVFDVTRPQEPVLLAEWDLSPECPSDWYGHTVDVAVRNGRRFVTLDAEQFDLGTQSKDEQALGCGAVVGNGDKAGPLWIVDATDLGKLGPAVANGADHDARLKANSAAALVTTWTNPAGRPGGHLHFSPHNQQIVGDRIYLSHYHGGVYVLDASAAFRGEHARPTELGVHVPGNPQVRPIWDSEPDPLLPFVSDLPDDRSSIWDAVFYRGYILAADEHGGLYSLQYAGDAAAAGKTAAISVAPARGGARRPALSHSMSVAELLAPILQPSMRLQPPTAVADARYRMTCPIATTRR
jgi:hypothetical protein